MGLADYLTVPEFGRLRRLARSPLGWSPEEPGPWLRRLPWLCVGLCYATWLVQVAVLPRVEGGLETWHYAPGRALLAMRLLLLIFVPVTGALSFQRERDRGTLEAMLLTPGERGPIIWGRCLWVIRFWLPCILALLPLYALMCSHSVDAYNSVYLFEFLRGDAGCWPKALRTLLLPRPLFYLSWFNRPAELSWLGGVPGPGVLGLAVTVPVHLLLNVIGTPVLPLGPRLVVVNVLRIPGDLLLLWFLAGMSVYSSARWRSLAKSIGMAYLLGPFLLMTVLSLDIWMCPAAHGHWFVILPLLCWMSRIHFPVSLLRKAGRNFDRYLAEAD